MDRYCTSLPFLLKVPVVGEHHLQLNIYGDNSSVFQVYLLRNTSAYQQDENKNIKYNE
jgi:hypothetical protein